MIGYPLTLFHVLNIAEIEFVLMSEVVFSKPKKKEESLSLVQKCDRFIDYLSVVPEIKEKYIQPLVNYYKDGTDILIFSRTLIKQGGVLCEIINILKENIIKNVDGWKSSELKEKDLSELENNKKNVISFLNSCKEDLYMTDEQLFLIDDVFNESIESLAVVMMPILLLLKRIKSVGKVNFVKKLKGIPEEERISFLVKKKEPEEEFDESKTEVKKGTQLEHIVNEIIETERIYVNDLSKFQEYKKEAVYSKFFDEKTIEEIFLNIDELLIFQRVFLVDMERAISHRYLEDMSIGNLFINANSGFKCYENFCSRYNNACEVVKKEENKLKTIGSTGIENPAREFGSFLIKPTQRICKYPLLLRELIKSLPKDSEERENLSNGMKAVAQITANVNEKQRLLENYDKAEEIKEEVDDKRLFNEKETGLLKLYTDATVLFDDNKKDLFCVLYEKRLFLLKQSSDKKGFLSSKKSSKYTTQKNINIEEIEKALLLPESASPNTLRLVVYYEKDDVEEMVEISFKKKEDSDRWCSTINILIKKSIGGKETEKGKEIRIGCMEEFYLIKEIEKEMFTIKNIKNLIKEKIKTDSFVLKKKEKELEFLLKYSENDFLSLTRLKAKEVDDGIWINILNEEDLMEFNEKEVVTFDLVF